MKISARVENSQGKHEVILQTDAAVHSISIPPRSAGFGSSANGGELLFLALATCYCNHIYREAGRVGITVESVEVHVDGEFGGPGEPAQNVTYRARVKAHASQDRILDLMRATDEVTEIQNTLRVCTPVTLSEIEAESI